MDPILIIRLRALISFSNFICPSHDILKSRPLLFCVVFLSVAPHCTNSSLPWPFVSADGHVNGVFAQGRPMPQGIHNSDSNYAACRPFTASVHRVPAVLLRPTTDGYRFRPTNDWPSFEPSNAGFCLLAQAAQPTYVALLRVYSSFRKNLHSGSNCESSSSARNWLSRRQQTELFIAGLYKRR